MCQDIFAHLCPSCRSGALDFAPSRIGSYWLNDLDGNTQIDVIAVDQQNKKIFAGECKYHNKPVDAPVYFALEEKVQKSADLKAAFPGCQVLYGLFSKSGFTQRLLELAQSGSQLVLIQEDHIIKPEP